MVNHLLGQDIVLPGKKEVMQLTRKNIVVVRPDVGRNIAASRLEQYLGVDGVSFSKFRKSGSDVQVFELTEKEQQLVKGKVAVLYDDEASTVSTLRNLVDRLDTYGVTAVVALLAHLKLTEEWLDKIDHPLLTTVIGTDSRVSVGNPWLAPKLHRISLIDWLHEIIGADIEGVDFWNSGFRDLVLQPTPEELAE